MHPLIPSLRKASSFIQDCRSSSLPANESQFAFTGCYIKVVDQIELSRPFVAGLLAALVGINTSIT